MFVFLTYCTFRNKMTIEMTHNILYTFTTSFISWLNHLASVSFKVGEIYFRIVFSSNSDSNSYENSLSDFEVSSRSTDNFKAMLLKSYVVKNCYCKLKSSSGVLQINATPIGMANCQSMEASIVRCCSFDSCFAYQQTIVKLTNSSEWS